MPHPFIHPARVAEKVATVDILSKGRVEWGTGRSTPMEQTAFGVDASRSKDQWRAAVQTVVGMWESEYYEEHSEFLDFPRRMVTPKPVQDPHPPAWMAGVSPGTAAVAGQAGLGLLAMSIMNPLDQTAATIRQYREAAANPSPLTRISNDKVAAYTLVHCADSVSAAADNGIWDSVWWWYHHLAEFTLEWEFPHFSQEEKDRVFPLLTARANGEFDVAAFDDADMIIVGDPERCYQKMCHYADIGVDELICYVQFGHLPHASVMRTIELLGQEVIPALDRYVPKR
jgi:alkanesulfonate monooxygenase SsuD/methylene tetrahydromethanopterin reductase-like flavin-dependent oxidoreductase (luciferase family)